MASAQRLPAEKASERRLPLTFDAAKKILWESAWSALFRAFLIQVLGSIAVSMLGEVFTEMTPSLPPGLTQKPEAERLPSPSLQGIKAFMVENNFWVIFGIVYFAIAATSFARYLRNPEHRRLAAGLLRVHRRLSCHWFRVFVLNGFMAWISAMILMALQGFSWTQIVWTVLGGVLQPLVHALARWIPGAGSLESWYSWYGQNQAKFLFWLFYSAAICDDLGLPNYKTLLRWGGRRLRSYFRTRWGSRQEESTKLTVN
jgi:hypothetical protein